MPRRCLYYNCSTQDSLLYKWPRDPNIARVWTAFVSTKRAQWKPSSSSVLCRKHFTTEAFDNYMEYNAGFANSLRLKKDSVPTLHLNDSVVSNSVDSPQKADFLSPQMQKGRSAFEKRRRLAMVNDATQPSVAEPELQSIDFEIDGDGDLDKMWETVAVQTEPITSSKAIQTLKWKPKYFCQRRHFPKYSKPKIKSYKIRRTSRGVQCSLLSPKTRPKKRYRKASQSSVSSNKTDSDEEYRPECDTETESDDEFQEESLKFEEMKNEDDVDFQDQTKFIVYQSALLILFQFCSICKGENLVSKSVSSTCLTVRTQCKLCNHRTTWKSEPSIKGIPVTSILLSVGILLTGSLTAKVIRLFNFIKIQCLSTRTVYNHHSKYIHAAIRQVWERKRETMLDSLKSSPLLIGGDGRCDSPGHSAKYCSYSIMNLETNKIITSELVQSNEVTSSNAMELEGLKRCAEKLKKFKITALVTDMHLSVRKWARDTWKIPHYYDTWHCVKAVTRKLERLGKQKDMEVIKEWIPNIKVHLYWCAQSSESGDHETIKQKWLTCIQHVQNNHENCLHASYSKKKKWLIPGSNVASEFENLATNTRTVNQISNMSSYGQTSSIECFHNILNHFAPKMIHFSYVGMLSRICIAILHYNENSERIQAETKTGNQRWQVHYPKYKDGHVLRKILTKTTHDYVKLCFAEVFNNIKRRPHDSSKINVPATLIADRKRVVKDEAVIYHTSRFKKVTEKVKGKSKSTVLATQPKKRFRKLTVNTESIDEVIREVLESDLVDN